MREIRRVTRGLMTVARRRGVGYFGYLVNGVAVPWALYRFTWGPQAPGVARHLFQAAARLLGRRPSRQQLVDAGLLLPERGADAVPAAASPEDLLPLMERAHRFGVTGVAGGFDRAVRVDGEVRFSSLPHPRLFRRGSTLHQAGRDADRVAFNGRFGAGLMTEERARTALGRITSRLPASGRDYAPIDFGHGLVVSQVASTDSGTGRWHYCNRRVVAPLVVQKRVLDLGCNNGALSLMMLRAGAREVLGVELSPEIADSARLNGEIFSWRDGRSYAFTVRTGDMRAFLHDDFGGFDVVTAFCSLYYLPEPDMAAIIRKAAGMGAILILQANDRIRGNLPATTPDLERLMRGHGYPSTVVHAPPGFARPLLVGRPGPSPSACA
jgi:SAM-dependent methyltransferase